MTAVQFDYRTTMLNRSSIGRYASERTPNPAPSRPRTGNVHPCSWPPQVAAEYWMQAHSPEDLPLHCQSRSTTITLAIPTPVAGEGRLVFLEVISKYGIHGDRQRQPGATPLLSLSPQSDATRCAAVSNRGKRPTRNRNSKQDGYDVVWSRRDDECAQASYKLDAGLREG